MSNSYVCEMYITLQNPQTKPVHKGNALIGILPHKSLAVGIKIEDQTSKSMGKTNQV